MRIDGEGISLPVAAVTDSWGNRAAVATAVALPVLTVLLRVAQDPTVRLVAQDPDVLAAWRDAYGPFKRACRVTSEAWKRNGGANGSAAA